MSFTNEIGPQGKTMVSKRPQISSYDLCHEHSVEHWIELRILVEEFAKETILICEPSKAAIAHA